MLHKDRDYNVYKDKLGHQDKDDKENGCNDRRNAAVTHAISCVIARVSEGVFHDAVPVVPGGYPEQGEECHAKITEMRVLSQTLAWNFFTAFC